MQNVPPLGFCTGLENSELIRQAGADFLEVNVQNFLVPRDDDAKFAPHQEAAAKLGFPIPCASVFLPKTLPCVGPAVDEAALLAYADNAFARAARVGIGHIVFGSGAARQIPEGFRWSVRASNS